LEEEELMQLKKKTLWMSVLSFVVMAGMAAAQTVTAPRLLVSYPELIIHNAKIATVDDAGFNTNPGKIVQAMAVRQGKVLALGTDAEILALAGPNTRKVDLKGRTVIPGIMNTHSHMHDHSIQLWSRKNQDKIEEVRRAFSVTGKDFAELRKGIELVVKEQMANPTPDQWAYITLPNGGSTGTGIGVQFLNQKAITHDELNKLAPNLPVFLNSHPAWLINRSAQNSFLTLYGLDWSQENVDRALTMNTTIVRSLVVDRYFANHVEEMADIIRDGLMHQAALGQTSYSSHIVGLRIHDGYMHLVRTGQMPLRFAYADRFCQQVEPEMPGCFIRKGDVAGLGDEYFWSVGVTLGGIDTGPPRICTTMEAEAKFKSAEQCILTPGSEYDKAIAAAVRSRLRYVVNHVYGDKAMDYFMDSVERVAKSNPTLNMDYIRSRRLTADHCGFYPRQEQLARIKNFNMVISCDPMFLDRSFPWLDVYGKDKANRIGPIASMIKAGIMTTAESEVDVETGTGPTYFAHQIHFITRKNSRSQLVAPEEAVDRVTLMKMMTTWPSYFMIKEKELGSLEPGKYADFVVLSKDYFTVPEAEIPTIIPLWTVLGGKTTVLRKELATELGTEPVGPQLIFKFATDFEEGDGGG